MVKRWLHTATCFSFLDLCVLAAGKVSLIPKTERFASLEDRKNKLDILYQHKNSSFTLFNKDVVEVLFNEKGKRYRCFLRLRGSDVFAFHQVMILREYEFVLTIFKQYFERLPITLIDAGANIGLASLFFKAASTEAKIFAIESDAANYEQALRNLQINEITSVSVTHRALWSSVQKLEVTNDFRDKMDWSLRVKANDQGTLTSISPKEAIAELGDSVDIFKIDIEGGEAEIFKSGNNHDWINKVRTLAIEIHEEFVSVQKIESVLKEHGFIFFSQGELTVAINKAFL